MGFNNGTSLYFIKVLMKENEIFSMHIFPMFMCSAVCLEVTPPSALLFV